MGDHQKPRFSFGADPTIRERIRVVSPPAANANIARHLIDMAASQPSRAALKIPRGRTRAGGIDYLILNFADLKIEADNWHVRLAAAGTQRGDRVLVMVRQGLPLIASAFALFQIGAIPIIIDPGMGLKSFLGCVRRSRPRALVGIPLAQIGSRIFFREFSSVEKRVFASSSLMARLPNNGRRAPLEFQTASSAATDLAAILFTSGSTGAPKGVCYEHGMFEAQIRIIRETYQIEPGEIDLPMLPIFALFNPALGMTTIVPEIDPRHPAAVDPEKIIQAIRQENVTNSFGSPTLWRKIGNCCLTKKITLPSLRRVLCAGAPVPGALWESSRTWMPQGRLHSPYGATEALPISTISSDEISPPTANADQRRSGACVGRPVESVEIKIIGITDEAIPTLAHARELPCGEIGEIVGCGPMVTKVYDDNPAATAAAKISDSARTWHRMGDCGYLDVNGRLWFCGRKAERVETGGATLFTELCEHVFRAHPSVGRCALIGLGQRGQQRPAIVIEASPKNADAARAFARELRDLAGSRPETTRITLFYFHPQFPVDVRHNAKIHRLALARWAATANGFDVTTK